MTAESVRCWNVATACVSYVRSPWEGLVSYVCSARASVASITKNVEALAEEYGNPVELAGKTRSTLPAPEVLAQASESRLWELGLGIQGATGHDFSSIDTSTSRGQVGRPYLRLLLSTRW